MKKSEIKIFFCLNQKCVYHCFQLFMFLMTTTSCDWKHHQLFSDQITCERGCSVRWWCAIEGLSSWCELKLSKSVAAGDWKKLKKEIPMCTPPGFDPPSPVWQPTALPTVLPQPSIYILHNSTEHRTHHSSQSPKTTVLLLCIVSWLCR